MSTTTTEKPKAAAQPAGTFFTGAELTAIRSAADHLAQIEVRQREVDEAFMRAKAEAASAPPPTPVDEVLQSAKAYLGAKPMPPQAEPDRTAAINAQRALPGLRQMSEELSDEHAKARSALRLAIVSALRASRLRAVASYCAAAALVCESAAAMDGIECLLSTLVTDPLALDPDGIWRNRSKLLAPRAELRPRDARVEEHNFIELLFTPDSPRHDHAASKQRGAAQAELHAALGAARWPF